MHSWALQEPESRKPGLLTGGEEAESPQPSGLTFIDTRSFCLLRSSSRGRPGMGLSQDLWGTDSYPPEGLYTCFPALGQGSPYPDILRLILQVSAATSSSPWRVISRVTLWNRGVGLLIFWLSPPSRRVWVPRGGVVCLCWVTFPPHLSPMLSVPPNIFTSNAPHSWDFPGGPAVKTPNCHCRGHGLSPCSGNQDPTCCAVRPKLFKNNRNIVPRSLQIQPSRSDKRHVLVEWSNKNSKREIWEWTVFNKLATTRLESWKLSSPEKTHAVFVRVLKRLWFQEKFPAHR